MTEQASAFLDGIQSDVQGKAMSFADIIPEQTVLLIADMIKGFTHFGSLSSERVGNLVTPIETFAQKLAGLGVEIIALADAHSQDSPEFSSYPVHCLAGSEEGELIDGLKAIDGVRLIHKNSTNGYLEPEFQRLIKVNPQWKRFLIVGNCTDICVLQLALTLKAHFNRLDQAVAIQVVTQLVETYDAPFHNGDLSHAFALYLMQQSGIELIQMEG